MEQLRQTRLDAMRLEPLMMLTRTAQALKGRGNEAVTRDVPVSGVISQPEVSPMFLNQQEGQKRR